MEPVDRIGRVDDRDGGVLQRIFFQLSSESSARDLVDDAIKGALVGEGQIEVDWDEINAEIEGPIDKRWLDEALPFLGEESVADGVSSRHGRKIES